MVRLLLMTLALVGMIAMNAAANLLPLNGQTTGEISNRLPVLFTPADYVFSIWSAIYILLIFWIFGLWKEFKKGKVPSIQITFYFVASVLFNISWLFAWHHESFIFSLVLMLGYLLALAGLYFQYKDPVRMRIPISVSFSWICVALISNTSYVLTYYNWSGWGLSDALWAVVMLTAGTALALHFRYHYHDIAFPLVFIWAFIGIAIKHGFDELLVSTASLFLSGVLAAGILFIKKRPA